jgi:hypothetical protein
MTLFIYFSYIFHIFYTLPVFFKHYYVLSIHFFHICKTYYVFSIHFSVFLIHFSLFLIHYLCFNQSHKAYDVRDQRKSGPWSPLGKYIYRMKNSHNQGLACTSSITRELMEHGGRPKKLNK